MVTNTDDRKKNLSSCHLQQQHIHYLSVILHSALNSFAFCPNFFFVVLPPRDYSQTLNKLLTGSIFDFIFLYIYNNMSAFRHFSNYFSVGFLPRFLYCSSVCMR